jgi:hypothetical protein
MDETVENFLVEVIEEATGRSSKQWALLLVALLAGAGVALWLTSRRGAGRADTVRTDEPV